MIRTMNRVTVGALTIAVVFGLLCFVPMMAHASPKTTVYVVTKEVKTVAPNEYYVDGELTKVSVKYTNKYSYNKVGLIKKYKENTWESTGRTWVSGIKFKFNKKYGFVSGKFKTSSGESGTQYYTLNKKGRAKSCSGVKYKYYPNGRTKKVGGYGWSNTFTWNSKGLTKILHKEQDYKITTHFTYNAKKNLATKTEVHPDGSELKYTFANKYKGGKLVKRVSTQINPEGDGVDVLYDTVTYKYKKIKVPKKMAAQVKAQQRWIMLQSATPYYPPLESMYK